MNDLAHPPRLASIVFMRLPGFDGKPVREQAALGEELHALIGGVLADLPPEHRLVLEAPGGAALVIPDHPALALTIAERLQERAGALEVAIGINHGPVKLWQMEDSTALIGDGLQAAAITASFATPQRWLAARAFRDALQQAAPAEAERLAAAGLFTDTQVRSHELFALDVAAALRRRRRLYIGGAVAVAAILAGGVALRQMRKQAESAPPPGTHYSLPALVTLDVRPGGDISVDGQFVGQLPEQRELYLSPGRHRIEVRFGQQQPLVSEVNLHERERFTLTHRFALPQAPAAQAGPQSARRIGRDALPPSSGTPGSPQPQQQSREDNEQPGFWRRLFRGARERREQQHQNTPVTP